MNVVTKKHYYKREFANKVREDDYIFNEYRRNPQDDEWIEVDQITTVGNDICSDKISTVTITTKHFTITKDADDKIAVVTGYDYPD